MSEQASYQDTRDQVLKLLDEGDGNGAFRQFRSVLSFGFKALDGTEAQFADAFSVFARIATHFAPEDFVALVQGVADKPNDVQTLYDLGFALYEESLYGIAATALDRADRLSPGQASIVSELVCSLESEGLNTAAVAVLQKYPELQSQDFLFPYLLAFNSLASGDADRFREVAPHVGELADADDASHRVMVDRIRTFLGRLEQVADVCALDSRDLRGWHYVMNGGVLTRLSPYGFPDPMNGRFAFLQETLENCHRGLQLLGEVIRQSDVVYERVFALPDRGSQILACAASKFFDLPLVDWPDEGTNDGGLIVAFNTSDVEWSEPLSQSRPGQLLYSHAMNWTEASPVSPDVVAILYQTLIAPWDSTMRVDQETNEMVNDPPDDRPPSEIAAELIASDTNGDEPLDDDEQIPPELCNKFLSAIGSFPPSTGKRDRSWECSPVLSARFL